MVGRQPHPRTTPVPVRLLATVLLTVVLLPSGSASAQVEDEERRSRTPSPYEATSRYRALADEAAEAENAIRARANMSDLEIEIEVLEQRVGELHVLVATLVEAEYMRPERIARLRDQAIQYEQRLEALREQTVQRLRDLDQLRATWSQHRAFWQSWRAALSDDPGLAAVEPRFRQALQQIDSVIHQIDAALPDVLRVQDEITTLRADASHLASYLAAIRAGRRQALLQQGQPILFSPGYFAELTPELWWDWRPLVALRGEGLRAFLRTNLALLLIHLGLILALILFARRIRGHSIPEGAWSGLLLRPRAFAVFSATSLLASRYALAPPVWDVVIWTLLASSGAVLATRLLRQAPLRRMVYVFAFLYPVVLLAEALHTPVPLFRPVLAGMAVAGVLFFGFLLRREQANETPDAWTRWPLGLGIAMWAAVLVAEVLGFYLMARWILHATVTSAYVVFVVVFLVVLARGAIGTLLRLEAKGRLAFLRTIGVPVVRQFLRLFQVVLVVVAVLYVLDLWEITPAPAETWRWITGVGVTVADIQITLGRVLIAGILLYFAIAFSWVLRTFARSEVYPRWEFERGVGESVNTLLHYLLITVGFFIALGALGVQLRNFAIIAGALGVGIGFGLQNIVNNFVSGLILLFERPVRVGDTIVLGSELGVIEKIGLRSTVVLTLDRAEVIVPNADLVSEKVTNWTLTDPVARLIIPVGVAYGTRVSRVLDILREVAAMHPEVLPDPPPQALFTGFGDSALDFELRVWVEELKLRLLVRSAMLAEIDRRFRDEGIEIPFPQRDLHVRSIDPAIVDAVGRGRGQGEGGAAEAPNG
jgi:potassium-dependent mechanosensitive channel